MKLTGLAWKPDEIAKRCINRHVLAICLILQLLAWVLLAIAAFSIHWAIGITIIGSVPGSVESARWRDDIETTLPSR
jgi:predicted Na+-dependent transporter